MSDSKSRLYGSSRGLLGSPHCTWKKILFQKRQFFVHGCVFLLHTFDVCKGVAENFRFLETPCTCSTVFIDSGGGDCLFQGEEFGVHVCAIAFLDDVVSGSLSGVARLWVLARGAVGVL